MTLRTLTILALLAAPAAADDWGPGGLGMSHAFTVQGAYLDGERFGGSGTGLLVRAEGLLLPQATALGNRAGFLINMELGYESYDDGPSDDLAAGPMGFDVSVGFPVTLFYAGGGDSVGAQLIVAPGFGMGVTQAYGFLQGRLGMTVVPNSVDVEAVYQWTPMEASSTYEDDTGLDKATARVAAYISLDDDVTFSVFAEVTQSDIERYAPGAAETGDLYSRADPLLPPQRDTYGRGFKLGGGWVW